MLNKFKEALNEALKAAQAMDMFYGGMASILVSYNPYTTLWASEANWSLGLKVKIETDTLDAAIEELISRLHECRDRMDWAMQGS